MEKIKNEVWKNLIGYNPDREVKELILSEVATTGKTLQQVIGEGKIIPIMPETGILDDSGRFEYRGERMTAKRFEEVNPLGEFGKIIIIGTQAQVEKHKNLCK
jgi:hypothetical protein